MKIEIWSDVVCPFCYIGYERLQKAIATTASNENIEIEWKSFQLDPDFPTNESLSTYAYLETKKGLPKEQAVAMTAQLATQGTEEGISLNFDKAIVANTKKAHRLLHLAKTMGKGTEVKTSLLKAHFTEGLNVDDTAVLKQIAHQFQLPEDKLTEALETDLYDYEIQQDIQEGHNLGLKGVPFFVFDRAYGIPGAQPLDVFEKTLQQCIDKQKETAVKEAANYCDPETGKCE